MVSIKRKIFSVEKFSPIKEMFLISSQKILTRSKEDGSSHKKIYKLVLHRILSFFLVPGIYAIA
jgi:hypothetical protein